MNFKNLLLVTFCGCTLLISSCNKVDETTLTEAIEINAENVLKGSGTFQSSAHPTSGTVQYILGKSNLYVQLKNFKSDNGPDLYVYLAKDKQAKDKIDLGKLKSTNGNFYYTAPVGTNIAAYNQVLIWCEDFSVLFGFAEVK
jgi:hypothetical protein